MNSTHFKGKVTIVTGAGRGMGKSVAIQLAKQGANLLINDIDTELAEATAKQIIRLGGTAIAHNANISIEAEVKSLIHTCISHYNTIHILINAAGILRPTKVIKITQKEWDLVMDVNLKGTFLCSKTVLPYLRKEKWGRIINFSSTAGKSVSTIGGAHYTASKAGVLGFTRHLAKEEANHGITVNAICPGLIDTEMVRMTIDEVSINKFTQQFPINRLGTPEEVSELVMFLASENASYITGASLDINGGDLTI